MELISRFFKIPRESFILMGPRGTGKSTWLRDSLPDAIQLDVETPSLRHTLAARPQRLRELLAEPPAPRTVVIDEIQHVPKLLRTVRQTLARPSPPHFVLAASGSRIFSRGTDGHSDLRLPRHSFHPLMAAELRNFDLDRALRHGMLPEAVTASNPQRVIEEYNHVYIADVMARGLTRHIGRFRRFLQALSTAHGKPLNIASVARGCAVERKIVAGYIAILEDLMLAFRVPVYAKRTIASGAGVSDTRRITVSRDKLFLFDAGFFRALLPEDSTGRQAEHDLQALAGLVAQHILAWSAYSRFDAKLCYWRTRAGTEVDLVVHGAAGIQAFRIQNGEDVGPRDLKALHALRKDHPDVEAAILYRGSETNRIDGVHCLPVEDFLRRMRPDRGLLELV